MGHSDTGDELPAYVRNARGEADPERVGRWVEELNRTGQTVLRTGFFKTLGFALISWELSVFFALPFVGTPAPIWIPVWEPLETPSSWAVSILSGALFAVGLAVSVTGALMFTVAIPLLRPRTIVSRWGIRTIWWVPGGSFTQFSAAWADIDLIDGFSPHTMEPRMWPLRPILHVRITASGPTVKNTLLLPRKKSLRAASDGQRTYLLSLLLRGGSSERLAFLLQAQEQFAK